MIPSPNQGQVSIGFDGHLSIFKLAGEFDG